MRENMPNSRRPSSATPDTVSFSMDQQTTLDDRWIPSVRPLVSRYYPNYPSGRFAELLAQSVNPSSRVLEIGAGSGRNHQNHFDLRGKVAGYVGVDLDPLVLGNPFLNESYQASADALPFADQSFDVVFHNFVAEHFEAPLSCNRDIFRVLKPGGMLLFQTPSRYYYAAVAASLTPHWFHEFYIKRFASGRTGGEVFPTFYRLNDAKTINRQLQSCGFDRPQIEHHSLPPGYLRFNKFAFLAGVFFERTCERRFPALRGQIIVLARKRRSAESVNSPGYIPNQRSV
jgi:SAM-dependent methyltransferase